MSLKDRNVLKIVKTYKKQMIGQPLTEDVHNDLNDEIFKFQKILMRFMSRNSKLDPAILNELKNIDKDLDILRTGKLHDIRPGR